MISFQEDLGAGEYADAYRQAKSAGYDLSYNQVKTLLKLVNQ